MEGLAEALARRAREEPERVAFRVKRDGAYQTWTYGGIYDQTRRLIGRMRAEGVRPGDRVALFGENSPEWVLSYLAVHLMEAVVVPLDAQYGKRELLTCLRFAEVTTLGYGATRASPAREVAAELSLRAVAIEALVDQAASSPPADQDLSYDPAALMVLIFTSGTTGDPKAVRLTAGNVYSNIEAVRRLNLIRPDDIVLGILPLHHAYAMNTVTLGSLFIGGGITFCASLASEDLLTAVRETGVTIFPGVPRLFEAFDQAMQRKLGSGPRLRRWFAGGLVKASRAVRRVTGWNPGRLLFRPVHRTFGPSLRFFACGGAKLDPAIAERFLDLGLILVEGYGLSETAPVLSFDTPDHPHPGTVGRPLPGIEVRIFEPDEESGVGEIIARGPNVMDGYEKRPDATREVLRDGWFHTGDLGFIDRDGCLRITGRAKEVIVLPSGKNIYPEELEKHYGQSLLVRELCVVPDEAADGRVTRLRAVVVPDEDECRRRRTVSVEPAVRQEIGSLSQELPSYLRVRDITLVRQELPRTRLGKLRRTKVMELLERQRSDRLEDEGPAPSAEDQALMERPGAGRLLERIQELSPRERPVRLSDHLELDVGLDSLARVELDALLEREFGVKVPPSEIADIHTVADLVRRLEDGRQGEAGPVRWRELLAERAQPSLDRLFNLQRSGPVKFGVNAARMLVYAFARIALRLDVKGLRHLPPAGPYLLCPNHASLLDGPLVFISLPFRVLETTFFLGAESRFRTPVMRRLGKVGRVIPTATSDTLRASLQRTAEAIAMGRQVCIFPEGEVSRDGRLRPPRTGAGILACELGVPLVPVLVRGTFRSLSITHPKFRLVPVGVTFGPPIDPPRKDEYAPEDYQAVVDRWVEAIAALRREDDASGSLTAGQSPRVEEGGGGTSDE